MILALLADAWDFIVYLISCFCLGLIIVIPALCAFAPLFIGDHNKQA